MTITFKWMKYLLLIPLGPAMIIEGLWLIAIPEELIKERLLASVPAEIRIEIDGMRKKIIPGLYIKRAIIYSKDTELELKDINISPEISFFNGRPGFRMDANDGIVHGNLNLGGDAMIKTDGFRLKDFRNPYLKGDCGLFLVAEIEGRSGTIEFSCRDARLEPFKDKDVYLPLDLLKEIQGKININEKETILESITLSGKDIYGRIKGRIRNRIADINIELMPEKALNNTLMLLMPSSMVSPGYFKIELKREL